MRYIESPGTCFTVEKTLFLAGGITNCPDWQAEIVEKLKSTNLILMNPRRTDFPIHDPNAANFQIRWEHKHLAKADAILFWFPCETLCPIVLYELGAWVGRSKKLFIGVHPDYKRRQDVEIQTRLERPAEVISYYLDDLALRVTDWSDYV